MLLVLLWNLMTFTELKSLSRKIDQKQFGLRRNQNCDIIIYMCLWVSCLSGPSEDWAETCSLWYNHLKLRVLYHQNWALFIYIYIYIYIYWADILGWHQKFPDSLSLYISILYRSWRKKIASWKLDNIASSWQQNLPSHNPFE